MKKSLIITLCITMLLLSYVNVKVYAASIEHPVAGITTVLDKVNQLEIDMNKYLWTTTKVNLRKEASTNSDIITTLEKRVKVRKITSSEKWTLVEYGDYKGYVSSEYLRDTEFPSLDFTDEEIDLLAKIIWIESRGETDESTAASIIVVINRIKSVEFSDTLYEVLSDKNQFSSWKLLDTAKPTEREFELIYEVLNGEWNGLLSEDYVYFSTSPRNDNGTIKIGNHFFCEED